MFVICQEDVGLTGADAIFDYDGEDYTVGQSTILMGELSCYVPMTTKIMSSA